MESSAKLQRARALGVTALVCCVALAAKAAPGDLDADSLELYRVILEERTQPTGDVVQVKVDYPALKRDTRWKQLIRGLANTKPDQLASRQEQLAYWINAYNILAIDLVLNAYPLASIKDIGSFFSPVWKAIAGTIDGRGVTLEEIEHEILRPIGDPRIHAAIVCASVSCPPLSRAPFEAEKIDAQLDSIVRAWLSNSKKGLRLDRDDEILYLSKIFDWFETDFEAKGGVIQFVLPHMAPDDAVWLRAHQRDVDLEYFDYDWGLND